MFTNIYDIPVEKMSGETDTLAKYKGKVLLIVNTASKCGYTPQLEELQDLYEKYGRDGLVVLGFPSGQFLKQEFGTNTEIMIFCRANYGVSFPMYSKTKVKGKSKTPLYKYLIDNSPNRKGKGIKWNFEKFLINRNGEIMNRYLPKISPRYLKKDIEYLL